MKKLKIKLIYGIGNEDEKFSKTKHNIGKEIIKTYFSKPIRISNSLYEKYRNLILATNIGYVNESGKGLKELAVKFNLKPESILVIHDDADIIFPMFKISFGIDSAGHKGIESIIKYLKSKNFWRFRLGIQSKNRVLAEKIVLKNWSPKEKPIIEKFKKKFRIVLEKLSEGKLPNELNISKKYFINLK